MKRWLSLGIVVALLVAALALAQHRKPRADVSPDAVLHFIGDTEREISRLPLSATRLRDEDEIRIGNELAERYQSMEDLRDGETDPQQNKDFRRYITQVGANVAAHAERKLPYKFHYIPEAGMVNAFALPGGHVFIGEGLLDLMDSEDELAAVLGHEVEHIDRYHAAERLQVESRLRHLGLAGLLASLPLELFQAGYSKEQELEADREGTRLAVMTGYSPTGAVRMFEAFDRRFHEAQELQSKAEQAKSPQEETARVVLVALEDYFRSHPPSRDRAAQIESLMAQENWPAAQERPLAVAYLLWTNRADAALRRQKFKEAAGLAAQALRDKPDYEPSLRIEADAEYHQANFGRAADVYRELLKVNSSNAGYAQFFAFLLSAADRRTAAAQFAQAMPGFVNSPQTTDSLAGLQLLAGNSGAANHVYDELKQHPEDAQGPDRMAWLGWWYYVAGNPSRAFEMLGTASQQRPNNPVYLLNFAWTEIEQRSYKDALASLEGATSVMANGREGAAAKTPDDDLFAEISMATAVANWLAENRDQALANYQSAITRESSWTIPVWYKPQYSLMVSNTIAEMRAELERRKKKPAEKH